MRQRPRQRRISLLVNRTRGTSTSANPKFTVGPVRIAVAVVPAIATSAARTAGSSTGSAAPAGAHSAIRAGKAN
ncbi:MAG: hypothetical protein ACTS5I_17365, partial [Rhodanobacter sp.]